MALGEHREEYALWHRANKQDAGAAVVANIDRLAREQRWRITLDKKRLSTYLGRPVTRLGADLYATRRSESGDPEMGDATISYAEPVIDTSTAKIASRQRPKGQCVTKGGSWSERNQAKKYSKLLEGILHDNQGSYETTWDLTEHIFVDGQIFEAGVVKVYPDMGKGRVVHERAFSFEMFVDPMDARSGDPNCIHHRYAADKEDLIKRLSKTEGWNRAKERAVRTAKLHEDNRETTISGIETGMCSVYESWRKNGIHVIAVDGAGDKTLIYEEYERDYFPFAFYVWKRPRFGFFGTPQIDQCIIPQEMASTLLEFMSVNGALNAGGYVVAERGSAEEQDIIHNAAMKVIWYDKGAKPPVPYTPQLFTPQLFDFYNMMRGQVFELPGVSELASQGRKETSIESGVAIRTVNDLQSERFLPQSRRYEQLFVTIAKLDIDAIQDLRDAGVKVSAVLPNEGFLDEIDFDEIDLDSDRFEVIIAPSSSSEDTIAAQYQKVQELAAAGMMSPEATKWMMSQPNPDVMAFSNRENSTRRYMEKLCGQYEEFDAKKDRVGDVKKSPLPILNLALAYTIMNDCAVSMLADDAPEENLQLALDWLKEADALMAKASQAQAPAAPPMGPPGGQPMAPPQDMIGGGMPPEGMMPPEMAPVAA